ncbi:unnamed protein product [Cladocopium goreaui]|uniref:Ultraviolet-B receptor UVR8 n=1 Tax=Cladocopium goreaui TaxID=2562237 RepID=A0A9P1CRH1_9DINO|nr:unnamed protein product [Cladocopium goreaui]
MALLVTNLAGAVMAELSPVPKSIQEARAEVERASGIPAALQKLVREGQVLTEDAELPEDGCEIICVKDETPMWTWNTENPEAKQIEVDGNVVRCPNLCNDFVNVLTREPIRSGIHYFEFVMHKIGDEQWCGVTMMPELAGRRYDGRSLKAWTYYCGRQSRHEGSITDGKGALHANGKAILEFEKACRPGNVINMLVDGDKRILAFALDGRLQGACQVPGAKPLYVLTHVDTPADHVELRKPMLEDAPQEVLASLTGALLDIEKGEKLHGYYGGFHFNFPDGIWEADKLED